MKTNTTTRNGIGLENQIQIHKTEHRSRVSEQKRSIISEAENSRDREKRKTLYIF